MFGDMTRELPSVGWAGFLDTEALGQSFLSLVLAIFLGAVIAFHPTTARTVDTREEAELPKVLIMYALVGAVVGEIVLQYGMVVGFVIFGLGGLMRFRTDAASTRDTGRLIMVTLIGLISGLNLPHFAVMAAAFSWLLIYAFDGRPVCELEVSEIPKGKVKEAAEAYRVELAKLGCKVISEDRSFTKNRVIFVLRAPRNQTETRMTAALCEHVPAEVRGEIDWEVE
ncbi:hypothetical protein [Candidatus Viadribacter manganicus]|uniref:DUF4956 domain-containing protein n=1 Tax=Candidatus Viadribacter manganicus TaxID=1759059 RepID=A0A1B1AID2_9PROT|nr:hypothetical protein [Candidatus Viadribacter manganicus]ANP46324.1 hypothetical protein ATE48_10550 [Candidatus Viadribacter manganicus]